MTRTAAANTIDALRSSSLTDNHKDATVRGQNARFDLSIRDKLVAKNSCCFRNARTVVNPFTISPKLPKIGEKATESRRLSSRDAARYIRAARRYASAMNGRARSTKGATIATVTRAATTMMKHKAVKCIIMDTCWSTASRSFVKRLRRRPSGEGGRYGGREDDVWRIRRA